jgi:membrane protein CcdC involved in cytochrome C biogenesis
MYPFLLQFHSINRWAVLLLALIVLFRSFSGWQGRKAYTKQDNIFHSIFIGLLHLQLLTGILLYFIFSPVTQPILADFGASMKDKSLRFWAVEHTVGMVIGVIIAQAGRIVAKKAFSPELKHKKAFIYTLIAVLVMLLVIPFGIFNEARPLWR